MLTWRKTFVLMTFNAKGQPVRVGKDLFPDSGACLKSVKEPGLYFPCYCDEAVEVDEPLADLEGAQGEQALLLLSYVNALESGEMDVQAVPPEHLSKVVRIMSNRSKLLRLTSTGNLKPKEHGESEENNKPGQGDTQAVATNDLA